MAQIQTRLRIPLDHDHPLPYYLGVVEHSEARPASTAGFPPTMTRNPMCSWKKKMHGMTGTMRWRLYVTGPSTDSRAQIGCAKPVLQRIKSRNGKRATRKPLMMSSGRKPGRNESGTAEKTSIKRIAIED